MPNFNLSPELLQDQVEKEFKKLKWPAIKLENACDNSDKKKFALNNTQQFVSNYFTPKNPNGILLFHSVGSGKTLSAVSTVKNFQEQGFNAIWITRTTLKKDLDKALILLPTPSSFPVYSYKQWSNICKRKGENYRDLLEKAKKINPKTNDPFYKTVIIVDEAHKLYTKDLKPQELHSISVIQERVFESYLNSGENRARIVLMTGTPVTENPIEAIQLFNLLLTKPGDRFNISSFTNSFIDSDGEVVESEVEKFKNKTKGLISYIDMSGDKSKFAQIKYTEVFVPISDESIEAKAECNEVYSSCIKNGFNRFECKSAKDRCLFKNKVQASTKGKSQVSLLRKKCKIDIIEVQ
jgi:ribosome-associated translation inhibitor RaiA